MSGIPVYTSSPISAGAKAPGITPQTLSTSSNPGPPTTTSAANTSYPPAQPGAAPVPAPTWSAQRYIPVQPTPTIKTNLDGPPPPQPGAFPVSLNKGIPSLASAGEKYQPLSAPSQSQSMPQPYPPQMSIPPPTSAYGSKPPTSAASTTIGTPSTYPVPTSGGEYGAPRRSLEHPPGYQQNTYASEFTNDQRRAQASNSSTGLGGVSENVGGIDTENIWNTAKQWVSTAGSKIAETEAEVWRKINKQ